MSDMLTASYTSPVADLPAGARWVSTAPPKVVVTVEWMRGDETAALTETVQAFDAVFAAVVERAEDVAREWRLRNDARLALLAAVAASPTTERTPS